MKSILDFKKFKENKNKISMTTCYDFWSAQILNSSDVDVLLVGDSLSMVMHGHKNTIPATPEIMSLHIQSVSKGAPDKFIVGDLPFLSHRKGEVALMNTVDLTMKSGAHSVKIEGGSENNHLIKHIVDSGVPVMGHLGLTPQSLFQLGGFKVQGKSSKAAQKITDDAKYLQDSGCFALVLECIPSPLAKQITVELGIPTIGIGAGPDTDGQVLVLQDMLGMNPSFKPKFVRHFLNGHQSILNSVNRFNSDVKLGLFPTEKESYENL